MCGRYYVDNDTLKEIENTVQEVDRKISNMAITGDIHPTELAPVISASSSGKLLLTMQNWGYPGLQNRGVVFNARAESALDKRMFQYGIHNNRVAIPAGKFYEWNKQKEKSTFYTKRKSALYMAGFFDEFQDKPCFVIITTAANDSMKMVHERMPLILKENQIKNWIMDGTQIENILKQVPEQLYRETEYEQQTMFF